MIPEDTIARVRESINLVELIRESVPGLKKSGRNFLARCPFHQEKTPSFNVNPELGLFKCFGCGVGGDAFKFLMLQENLTYPEAIRKIATRVGVEVEEDRREVVTGDAKERQVLYGLLEDAARFYHRYLLESPEADAARTYLTKRGLTEESIKSFCIGYAPASGHALRDAAGRKGWSTEILEKAGLLKKRGDSGRIVDHFWNRIIFPIWDSQGRMVAFGGRAMGDAIPKYINSPETPVYSKSRHLYGLFQGLASLRQKRHMVILEGYMDVVVCHQFGFDYSAATLGTALTEDHVRLLRRYADRITLLFDPDSAGMAATVRGGELLIADGFTVDVVTLPDGKDPDELLVESGPGALEQFLKTAVPFMDYFIQATLKKHPGLSPESKLAAAREILPVIRKMKDPLLQDEHLSRLAQALHAEKSILGQQMKKIKADPAQAREQAAADATVAASVPLVKRGSLLTLEEELLLLALLFPSDSVASRLDTVVWTDERCQLAWVVLGPAVHQGHLRIADSLSSLPETIRPWLTELALQTRQYTKAEDILEGLLTAWTRQKEALQFSEMKASIDAMISGVLPMDDAKVRLYNDLSRKLKGGRGHG